MVAAAFLDGIWHPGRMAARAAHDLGVDGPVPPWLDRLGHVVWAAFPAAPVDAPGQLTAVVAATGLVPRFAGQHPRRRVRRWCRQGWAPIPLTSRLAPRLIRRVTDIAADEGFRLNVRKTRVMPRWTSQRLTGLVVNEAPRVPRRQVDQLRAVLSPAQRP